MTVQLDPMRLAEAERRLLADVPVRRRRMTFAGIETPVLEGGSGTPLVLLHGPGGGAVHWWRVLPALTRRHRVIAPDLPGQGAPLPAGAELDAPLVLRWLAELVDATCAAPPALAGQALGGAIAARFAAADPGRVGRLVLVDALGLATFAPAPAFRMALQAFAEDPEEATHEALWHRCAHDLPRLRTAIGGPWAAFVTANLERARTAHARAALGAMMEQFAFRAMPPAELAQIAAPTALVWGRHDLATPLAVAAAVSARRHWPLHVIDGAADDPPVEQPEAFARTLRAVIDGPGDLGALRRRVRGAVLVPGAAGFDAGTELWNGAAGSTPALVVQPTGAADVAAALDHARAHDLAVTVRGRGHHIGGAALTAGGLALDMALLRSVEVDPRGADRHRRSRLRARRGRCRHAAARPRHAARLRVGRRRRRAHARRRAGLPQPPLRLDGRQPPRGGDRHGGRVRPPREPRQRARPVLGRARRRRAPRRRHLLHLPPAPGGAARLRRPDRVAVRARRGGPARIPRADDGRRRAN